MSVQKLIPRFLYCGRNQLIREEVQVAMRTAFNPRYSRSFWPSFLLVRFFAFLEVSRGPRCSARRRLDTRYQRMRIRKCANIIDAIQCRRVSRRNLRGSAIGGIPGAKVEEIDIEFRSRLSASNAVPHCVAIRSVDVVPRIAWFQSLMRP